MKRITVTSGAKWEDIVCYRRAVKIGNTIEVSGTVAMINGELVGENDAYLQSKTCFKIIDKALKKLGASAANIIRTKMYVTDIKRDWEAIGRAHQEYLDGNPPAATMVEVKGLINPKLLIEIEVSAIVNS